MSSLELNHKNVDIARQGSEVCIRVESTGDAPRLYGRHFDHTDQLVSKVCQLALRPGHILKGKGGLGSTVYTVHVLVMLPENLVTWINGLHQ